jgi:hypothetical protein
MLDAERASRGANLNTPTAIIRFVFRTYALRATEGFRLPTSVGPFPVEKPD